METDTDVGSEARTIRIGLENGLLRTGEISTKFAVDEKTNELVEASLSFERSNTYTIVTYGKIFFLEEDRSVTHTDASVNVETAAELRAVRSDEVGKISASLEVEVNCIAFKTGTIHTIATESTLDAPCIVEVVNEIESCVERHNVSARKSRIGRLAVEVVDTAFYSELPLGRIISFFGIVSIGLLVEISSAAARSNNGNFILSSLLYRCLILGDNNHSVVTLSKDCRNSAQAER